MKKLTKEQINELHDFLVDETGGLKGLRDGGLLDSALQAPFQTFDGVWLYPTIERMAAQLGYALIMNHPYIDGNKRIGVTAMVIFLEMNDILITCTDDELIELGLGIAAGKLSDADILKWIQEHD